MTMKTSLFQDSQISEIVQKLKSEEIVALPTDTVFGLAALATSKLAVERLTTVKQRPQEKAFSYMVSSLSMIEEVCELSDCDRFIIEQFLPGPWTFIFNKKANQRLVDNGLETLAIRIPDLPITLEIIEQLGTGIYMPSANTSGQPSLIKAADVLATFDGKIAGVLNVDAQNNMASTIIDCTGKQLKLVRKGARDILEIVEKLKEYSMNDSQLFDLIDLESQRQVHHIEAIASENYVSSEVLKAQGSILTNKYAEGYPKARYYGGCEIIDEIEDLARERLKALFNAEHANVQPHSGSQANMAVYLAMLEPMDVVLGMDLAAGGHLTHGHPLNFSGILYQFASYGVDKETEMIDYEEVRKIAHEVKPKMIVAGASAYSRTIDFTKFREIADEVGAYLMVDMAHIAGLVAAGLHPNPVEVADFVTSTTHKTLRGPRGGIILCKEKYAKIIDRAVFPGSQGGPLMHIIAAKAVSFYEASKPEFISYGQQVVKNAKALADELSKLGYRIISSTTDNHLILVDVYSSTQLTGKEVEDLLGEVNITVNKNAIPFDTLKPMVTSGIRLGSAAMTTRGFKEADFRLLAQWIDQAIKGSKSKETIREEIVTHLEQFPIPN